MFYDSKVIDYLKSVICSHEILDIKKTKDASTLGLAQIAGFEQTVSMQCYQKQTSKLLEQKFIFQIPKYSHNPWVLVLSLPLEFVI